MGKAKVTSSPTLYKFIHATFKLRGGTSVKCGMFVLPGTKAHDKFLRIMEDRLTRDKTDKWVIYPSYECGAINGVVRVCKRSFTRDETLTDDPNGKRLYIVNETEFIQRFRASDLNDCTNAVWLNAYGLALMEQHYNLGYHKGRLRSSERDMGHVEGNEDDEGNEHLAWLNEDREFVTHLEGERRKAKTVIKLL